MADDKGTTERGAQEGPVITSTGHQSMPQRSQTVPEHFIPGQNQDLDSVDEKLLKKDAEIEVLQLRINELERENSDLKDELKSKESEIESLNKKARALQSDNKSSKAIANELRSDKKKLQEEVQSLKRIIEEQKTELDSLRTQVDSLHAQMQSLKDEKEEQKANMNKLRDDMNKKLQRITKSLDEANYARANLRKEINQMKLAQNMYSPGREELMAIETTAFIQFREMCRQLQNSMYKEVFPDNFVASTDFLVETIETDIEFEEDNEAETRWTCLKDDIEWKDIYVHTIKSIVGARNYFALKVPLKEQVLRSLLTEMKERNKLPKKGSMSPDKVKFLIDVWVKLHAR